MFINIFKVTSPGVIEEFIDAIDLDDKSVLVKVDTMAICKADIRYFLGNRDINVLNHKYPLAPIHEAVGHVIKDPTGTFKPGDKVILVPNSVDENYYMDKANRRCFRKDLGDNYYQKATFRSSTADGFLRNFYACSPDLLVKYEDVDSSIAVFSELLSVAHAAIRRIDFTESQSPLFFIHWIPLLIVSQKPPIKFPIPSKISVKNNSTESTSKSKMSRSSLNSDFSAFGVVSTSAQAIATIKRIAINFLILYVYNLFVVFKYQNFLLIK